MAPECCHWQLYEFQFCRSAIPCTRCGDRECTVTNLPVGSWLKEVAVAGGAQWRAQRNVGEVWHKASVFQRAQHSYSSYYRCCKKNSTHESLALYVIWRLSKISGAEKHKQWTWRDFSKDKQAVRTSHIAAITQHCNETSIIVMIILIIITTITAAVTLK